MSKAKCLFTNTKYKRPNKFYTPNPKSNNGDGPPKVSHVRRKPGSPEGHRYQKAAKTLTDQQVPFMTEPIQRTLNTPRPEVIRHGNIVADKRNNCSKEASTVTNVTRNSTLTMKKQSVRQRSTSCSVCPKLQTATMEKPVEKKETIMDTTSTLNNGMTPEEIIDKVTWAKMLDHRARESKRNIFDSCDPLRTLHFLVEELALKVSKSGNNVMTSIIQSIQEIMRRVPQNVTNVNVDKTNNKDLLWKPPVKQVKTSNKGCQTSVSTKASPVQTQFDKQCEEKFTYFEDKLTILEKDIFKLRQERDNLQHLLEKEKEICLALRNEIYTNDKIFQEEKSKFLAEIYTLSQKNDELNTGSQTQYNHEKQINFLLAQIKKLKSDAINAQLNHEKTQVLLKTRDKELQDLHAEFVNVHSMVKKQLDMPFLNTSHSTLNNASNIKSRIITTSSPKKPMTRKVDVLSPSWNEVSKIESHFSSSHNKQIDDSMKSKTKLRKRRPKPIDLSLVHESNCSTEISSPELVMMNSSKGTSFTAFKTDQKTEVTFKELPTDTCISNITGQ